MERQLPPEPLRRRYGANCKAGWEQEKKERRVSKKGKRSPNIGIAKKRAGKHTHIVAIFT